MSSVGRRSMRLAELYKESNVIVPKKPSKVVPKKPTKKVVPKKPTKQVDNYTEQILRMNFNTYKSFYVAIKESIEKTGLNLRSTNPPEYITENIVKFIIRNKKGDKTCVWANSVNKTGDLYSDVEHVQEVKAFTSDAPCTFGPTKKFSVIYFLDMRDWLNDKLILWCVNLNNTSKEWKGLKISKSQTYEDQCNQGRRPRIGFNKMYEQLKDHCTKVYEGTFTNIFTP